MLLPDMFRQVSISREGIHATLLCLVRCVDFLLIMISVDMKYPPFAECIVLGIVGWRNTE